MRRLAGSPFGALSLAIVFTLVRDASWFERRWPNEALESVREATASPGTQVISTSHLSDWLLWKLPELRGRLAYDVRFEIYTREDFERIVAYRGESRPDWRSLGADRGQGLLDRFTHGRLLVVERRFERGGGLFR